MPAGGQAGDADRQRHAVALGQRACPRRSRRASGARRPSACSGGQSARIIAISSPPMRASRSPWRMTACRSRGEVDEHAVAGGVAEAVVDRLEVVDVDEHQRQRAAVAQRALGLLGEALVERAAVGEPGQRVGQRLRREALAGVGVGDGDARELGEARDALLVLGAGTAPGRSRSATTMPHVLPSTTIGAPMRCCGGEQVACRAGRCGAARRARGAARRRGRRAPARRRSPVGSVVAPLRPHEPIVRYSSSPSKRRT